MKGEKWILISLAVMAAVTLGCGASAQIGAMPTPAPAPTAAPQVIVVQQPAPVSDDGGWVVTAALIGVMFGTIAATGYAIGYIRRGQESQAHNYNQPPTYILPPAESPALTEAEVFRILRQSGYSPEHAWSEIANARQRLLLGSGRDER